MIDDLRDFIRSTLEAEEASMPDKMKKPNANLPDISTVPGAGIVVVRQFDDGWRVLGLILGDFIDIPKGVIEDGVVFERVRRRTKSNAADRDAVVALLLHNSPVLFDRHGAVAISLDAVPINVRREHEP